MTGLRELWLAVVAFGSIWMVASIHGEGPQRPRIGLDDIEDRAIAAASGEPAVVRALVDEIFNRTIFASAPESVRERLTRAEIAFRRGAQRAIEEQEVVDQSNAAVAEMNGPEHARTNGAQFHLFRTFLGQTVRHFTAAPNSSREMSPAEMAFVVLNLASQKLTNDDYRVSPDQWVAKVGARQRLQRGVPATPESARPAQLRVARHDKELSDLYWALDRDLPLESGEITQGMHAFLDRVGVSR